MRMTAGGAELSFETVVSVLQESDLAEQKVAWGQLQVVYKRNLEVGHS